MDWRHHSRVAVVFAGFVRGEDQVDIIGRLESQLVSSGYHCKWGCAGVLAYLVCLVQGNFIVRLRRPDSAPPTVLEILHRQALDNKVSIRHPYIRPSLLHISLCAPRLGLIRRGAVLAVSAAERSRSGKVHPVRRRPGRQVCAAQAADEPRPLEAGVVESRQRRETGALGFVVDKGAVALRDEEHALEVFVHLAGEVILQIDDVRARGEIAHPQGMAGLFRFPERASG